MEGVFLQHDGSPACCFSLIGTGDDARWWTRTAARSPSAGNKMVKTAQLSEKDLLSDKQSCLAGCKQPTRRMATTWLVRVGAVESSTVV